MEGLKTWALRETEELKVFNSGDARGREVRSHLSRHDNSTFEKNHSSVQVGLDCRGRGVI